MPIVQDIIDFFTGIWEEQQQQATREAGATAPWLTPEARERVRSAEDPLAQIDQEIQDGNTQDVEDTVVDAIGDLFGTGIEAAEQDVVEELRGIDYTDLQAVNDGVDDAEGAAAAVISSLITTSIAAEAISVGQVDSFAPAVGQAIPALSLDDVTGTELQWWMEKGVGPALEAQVAKQSRSEFVDVQDAVEFLLRNKTADEGWITGGGIPEDMRQVIGSNVPVNEENPLEEWGIRDDQLQILEIVGLGVPEPEELFEELPQFGVVPNPEAVDLVLDYSGFPELVKEDFRRLQANIPRSADLWEQRTTTSDLVTELDTLVLDGEISADDAMELLPDEIDDARPALRQRWEIMADVPSKAPTRSQAESSFTVGFTDLDTLETRLAGIDVDPETYPDIVDEVILSEIDDELQVAFALGFISEGTYGQLMDRIGLDAETQEALFAGGDLDDVAERRLEERADPADQPVASVPGIGESRAAGLRAAGIETVGDLAQADVATVADAAGVSDETAQEFISAAQVRVG